MSCWQLLTVLTLGLAGAVGAAGLVLATGVFLIPSVHLAVATALGVAGLSAFWLAALIAAAGVAGGFVLVRAHRVVSFWFAQRELAKVRTVYQDIEMALGTEKAAEYAAFKRRQMQANRRRPSRDLFDRDVLGAR